MNKNSTRNNDGFLYGSGLGALFGVAIAGPHFHEWSWPVILAVFLGSSIGVGIAGYALIAIARLPGHKTQVSSTNDSPDDIPYYADMLDHNNHFHTD